MIMFHRFRCFIFISEKYAFDSLQNIMKKLLTKKTVRFVKSFNDGIDFNLFIRLERIYFGKIFKKTRNKEKFSTAKIISTGSSCQ